LLNDFNGLVGCFFAGLPFGREVLARADGPVLRWPVLHWPVCVLMGREAMVEKCGIFAAPDRDRGL